MNQGHATTSMETTSSARSMRCWSSTISTPARLPPMAKRLLNLFLELNRLGTAVVIATHDFGLMDQIDARRMILTEGRLDIYE